MLLKRGCVQLLVQKCFTVFGKSVKSPSKSFDHSVAAEFRQSVAGVVCDSNIKFLIESVRRQIALISQGLEDFLINGSHPLRSFSYHICFLFDRGHSFAVTYVFSVFPYKFGLVNTVNTYVGTENYLYEGRETTVT